MEASEGKVMHSTMHEDNDEERVDEELRPWVEPPGQPFSFFSCVRKLN